jgi:hypothetical protein
MFPPPHQLYDAALARQRELWAEAERYALVKEARLGARKTKPPRTFRPRFALVGAARSALAHLF